jgi:hypothetical protein
MDPKVLPGIGVLACLIACATPPPKQADSYDDNPPSESVGSSSHSSSSEGNSSQTSHSEPTEPATTAAAPSTDTTPAVTALPATLGMGWDRDLTAQELARAARSVKANCGSATDDDGNAKGPWGKTQVSVRLHHKGHTKDAKAEGEYAGTPVGHCIERAFSDLHFPPWEGHDVTIEYDIEVVKPH